MIPRFSKKPPVVTCSTNVSNGSELIQIYSNLDYFATAGIVISNKKKSQAYIDVMQSHPQLSSVKFYRPDVNLLNIVFMQ